jgi:hypothetical protein
VYVLTCVLAALYYIPETFLIWRVDTSLPTALASQLVNRGGFSFDASVFDPHTGRLFHLPKWRLNIPDGAENLPMLSLLALLHRIRIRTYQGSGHRVIASFILT